MGGLAKDISAMGRVVSVCMELSANLFRTLSQHVVRGASLGEGWPPRSGREEHFGDALRGYVFFSEAAPAPLDEELTIWKDVF